MSQESLRAGLGYVVGSDRYGYTDGSLWYLGECRQYVDSTTYRPKAISYDRLKSQVDSWIAANPATRATKPTTDEKLVGFGFAGVAVANRDFYRQNYNIVGKSDPLYESPPNSLAKVLNDSNLGIVGVGFGFIDFRINRRFGYSDGVFWYRGECRIFRVTEIPFGAVSTGTPPGLTDALPGYIDYVKAPNGRTYIKKSNGKHGLILDYASLISIVDSWLIGQEPVNQTNDWFQCGFFFQGQRHWQLAGGQSLPDWLVDMLAEPEKYASGLLANLPETSPIPTTTGTSGGGIAISLPQTRRQNGPDIATLYALSLLANNGSSRRRRRKRK